MFSWFFGIGAAALAVAAVLRWHSRSDIISRWPEATATVRHCGVHRDYPFQKNGGGIVVWVVCDVSYEVDGRSVETRVVSTSKHAGRSGTFYTLRDWHFVVEHPEATLEAWSRHHRRGTPVAIRYDPASPSMATFVGADASLDDDPVPGTLAGVVLFGLMAIGAGIGSSRFGRQTSSDAPAYTGTDRATGR